MVARGALIAALFVVVAASNAGEECSFCSKPLAPNCATYLSVDASQFEIESCADEINRYKADAQEYSDCVTDWANDEIEDVTYTLRRAVSNYNLNVGQY